MSDTRVNLPGWLPLVMNIDGSDWVHSDQVTSIDFHQQLDLKQGVLSRVLRLRDEADRVSRWEEKRIVSMHDQHLAALAVTVTPRDQSGIDVQVQAGTRAQGSGLQKMPPRKPEGSDT